MRLFFYVSSETDRADNDVMYMITPAFYWVQMVFLRRIKKMRRKFFLFFRCLMITM